MSSGVRFTAQAKIFSMQYLGGKEAMNMVDKNRVRPRIRRSILAMGDKLHAGKQKVGSDVFRTYSLA
jgi:hypothetical protein